MAVFVPFADLNAWITEAIGQGNPNALYQYVNHIHATQPDLYDHLFDNSLPSGHEVLRNIAAMQMSVSFGLSIFHTVFNLVNLSIMIWLTNVYVKIVEYLIPAKHTEEAEFQLKFISGGILSASELNIAQAEKEMVVYAERVRRMIDMSRNLVHTPEKSEEFNHLFSRIEKYEEISDRMELEIAHYLNRCAEGRLSNEGKLHIAAMLSIDSEIESIADCCYNIGRALVRKQQATVQFNDTIYNNIDTMFRHVEAAMDQMISLLGDVENVHEVDLLGSYNREREINNLRNQLRSGNVENINNRLYEYQSGIFYMDIIADLEKTGDYIINVVDTIKEQFRRPAGGR